MGGGEGENMITIEQYFGKWADHPDATPERKASAVALLETVNALFDAAADDPDGPELRINPKTDTQVSGTQYGGFRPKNCPEGSAHSSHKEGRGVDVYDPSNQLDDWLDDAKLERFGLYREHPSKTPHWCHLTDRAPGSGKRTFMP